MFIRISVTLALYPSHSKLEQSDTPDDWKDQLKVTINDALHPTEGQNLILHSPRSFTKLSAS